MSIEEQLNNLTQGSIIKGPVLISDYNTSKAKNNSEYIVGTLINKITVPFKAWSNKPAFNILKNNNLKGKVCTIQGTVDTYNGSTSIILENLCEEENIETSEFLEVNYNIDSILDSLKKTLVKNLSPNGQEVINIILFNQEYVLERFKKEFAAQKYHDNCLGGLLAHTYKLIKLLEFSNKLYGELFFINNEFNQDYKDLFFIGAILHDVGKIYEMKWGTYQLNSIVTHRALGYELLLKYKQDIVDRYDEYWFYELSSIILQHHGEFGENPKTIAAQVIHYFDNLEAQLTLISNEKKKLNWNDSIKIDNKYLSV